MFSSFIGKHNIYGRRQNYLIGHNLQIHMSSYAVLLTAAEFSEKTTRYE